MASGGPSRDHGFLVIGAARAQVILSVEPIRVVPFVKGKRVGHDIASVWDAEKNLPRLNTNGGSGKWNNVDGFENTRPNLAMQTERKVGSRYTDVKEIALSLHCSSALS
jgi:hypothetical protein